MKLWQLDEMVKTVCPIHGINSAGVIHFKPEATAEEKLAAEELVEQHIAEIELEQLGA